LLFLGLAAALLTPAHLTPAPVNSGSRFQLATLTSTPAGPIIVVPDQVNVRLGPGTNYEQVGVLIAGSTAPAIGRSPGGDWIQIIYFGVPGNVAWVYAPFVSLEGASNFLPIVEPPATSTPRVTPTIDPTFAAQFLDLGIGPTRLPTFTPAAAYVAPTPPATGLPETGGFPPILAVLGLMVVGVFGTVISFLRGGR
jgi:uncharacterized protein YraI